MANAIPIAAKNFKLILRCFIVVPSNAFRLIECFCFFNTRPLRHSAVPPRRSARNVRKFGVREKSKKHALIITIRIHFKPKNNNLSTFFKNFVEKLYFFIKFRNFFRLLRQYPPI